LVLRALRWCASVGWIPALARLILAALILALALTGLCAAMGINVRGASHSVWFASSVLFPALALAWGFSARARTWRWRLDNRIGDMLLATMLAIWLTLLGLLLGAHQAGGVIENVFDGWTASVIFWAFVGLIVAVVSLARPEDEGYEARARILFRGEQGPHIDHIVAALCGTIGHYAEKITRDITVREYLPDPGGGLGWFLLEIESTTTLRAYVEDHETIFTSQAVISNTKAAPPGARTARVVRAECSHVDGNKTPATITPGRDGYTIEYTTRFNRPGTCSFTIHRECWEREEAENAYEIGRFTRKVTARIRNLCPNKDPIWIECRTPAAPGRIPLHSTDGWLIIADRQDEKPDEIIHDFSLFA
jgi:hypothetical protein